ncbi:right-handed parallel beta-helix repeat-containing protein [Candidatus Parcubacteria bacterium]|nr:right-handed parallel beta-helix repeat-containing protein [Candidatus Parcubacteria bacterium]
MSKKNISKSFQWLICHSITIFSCVLIIALGIAVLTHANPGATTIGENISADGNLTVGGNATTTGSHYIGSDLSVLGNASTTGAFTLSGIASFLSDLTVSGNTTLATTTMATTTISALSSINNNIVYVKPEQTIQNAIDSITDESVDNPYTVIVPPGVYEISSQIALPEYISLEGAGMYQTIVKAVSSMSSIFGVYGHQIIKGIQFDGNLQGGGVNVLSTATYCTFRDVYVKDLATGGNQHCFNVAGQHILFDNCIAENAGGDDGFAFGSTCAYITARNCDSFDHTRAVGAPSGFEIDDGAHDILIEGCRAWNCNNAGIEIHSHTLSDPPCYNFILKNNVVSSINFASAFADVGHHGIIIENNLLSKLEVSYSRDIIIKNNIIKYVGHPNETIIMPDDVSLAIGSTVHNAEISGNVVRYGCFRVSGIKRAIITNNQVYGSNTNYAFRFQTGEDNVYANNFYQKADPKPESNLNSDAASGQKIVAVADGTQFELYMPVTISDDTPQSETNYVMSISGNSLTMLNNLTNTYTTAQNAKVEEKQPAYAYKVENLTRCRLRDNRTKPSGWISFGGDFDDTEFSGWYPEKNVFRSQTTDSNGQISITFAPKSNNKYRLSVELETNNLWYISSWTESGGYYTGCVVQVTATTSVPVGSGVTAHIFVGN